MLKDFLEFNMKIYSQKEASKYEVDMDRANESAVDMKLSEPIDVPPPPFTLGRIKIKPANIIYYIETYSLEEKYDNPEAPLLDSTTVFIKDAGEFTLDISYKAFEKRLEEFYKVK